MTGLTPEDAILAQERRALDRWSTGDPLGYVAGAADDVTYFDDIGAHERVDGGAALRAYASALQGQIPEHTYSLANPRVQIFGDIGILTYTYVPSGPDGGIGPSWKATAVYHRREQDWRLVHAHWSLVKVP